MMIKVSDSMGEMMVTKDAYYGASTQRAVLNFPVSGTTMPDGILHALALIKKEAARVNGELGLLTEEVVSAIDDAAAEVMGGKFQGQFPIDVYQTGSGTSTNMNMNEVIAARANEIMGSQRQGRTPVHPNDHVNLGQSSNDVIPSSIHIAVREYAGKSFLPALKTLKNSLSARSREFSRVVKVGRTHMQDAVPITLGQEFSGYASQVEHAMEAVEDTFLHLEELPLGGTAVGTGLNSHPRFAELVVLRIASQADIPFAIAPNRFAAMGGKDALVSLHKSLAAYASSLYKIASDIRFLACGPRCGIGEVAIPALQPGSSIMPGKVNPVIPESALQAAVRVMGNDVTVTMANASGNLELNVMMPLLAHVIMESLTLITNTTILMAKKCVDGISANIDRCEELVEQSLALITPLAQVIGYDEASRLAKEAGLTGKTVRQLVREKGILTEDEIKKALDPAGMVGN
ncbi:MAG TPA: class II fumarate hydratase [Proteobacteria bacterium]|nr:fumarate hydratase class II [bacterium BMS3Abin14]HDL54161.1 class II fumarate hydratase [Pseudomonadota bacterium]